MLPDLSNLTIEQISVAETMTMTVYAASQLCRLCESEESPSRYLDEGKGISV